MNILLEHIPPEFINPSEKFRKSLKDMGIHYWYLNISNNTVILSPDLRELLAITGDSFEESADRMKKMVHPDDIVNLQEMHQRILDKKDKVLEVDMRIRVKGDWIWYYVRGTVISTDDSGNPLIIGGITMDISKRYVRMLDRIEESRKFEFVFKTATQPVFVGKISLTDQPSEIIEANKAACELLQCSENDLIGKSPHDLLIKPFPGRRDEARSRFLATGMYTRETEIETFKGEKRYVEIKGHAFTQNKQQLFIAILNDKTESRKIRNELKASEFAFRRNERIYKTLIHAADDRIALFDLDGNIEIMNDAFFTTLGYTREEFNKGGLSDKIHPDDLNDVQLKGDELLEEGFSEYHYRVLHKNGYYLHMSAKGMRIEDADLDKVFLLFIVRDITQQVEFADELILAKEQAEESEKLKSAFLANISHEIRTPMNSIVGFANLLSENGLSTDEKKEYVDRINKNSGQLLALISDIIDLAKIESKQLSISYSKVYVNNLLQEVLKFAKNQLKLKNRKGLDIEYDPDPKHDNPAFDTDFVRIMQIMHNLVSNAIKFTTAGFVRIGYRMIGEQNIQLYVKDSGQGIKPENFELIFNQFRQEDGTDTRKFGGTGLGLTICKNLTDMLNGRIWVESEYGSGTTFFVELPLKSSNKIEQIFRIKESSQSTTSGKRIFVVDDDPDTLMLLSKIFDSAGFHVTTADSGYKALQKLENSVLPDLLMIDLQMPVIDGIQTMKIMKEKYPSLKIIAQSAHGFEGDLVKFRKAGFDDYVTKPYTKEQLLEAVIRNMPKPDK